VVVLTVVFKLLQNKISRTRLSVKIFLQFVQLNVDFVAPEEWFIAQNTAASVRQKEKRSRLCSSKNSVKMPRFVEQRVHCV